MTSNFNMVQEFHKTFEMFTSEKFDSNLLDNKKMVDLRVSLIEEEYNELKDAIVNKDNVEVIDALCDILYVTYGGGDSFGIDLSHPNKTHEGQLLKISDSFPINFSDEKSKEQIDIYVCQLDDKITDLKNGIQQKSEIDITNGFKGIIHIVYKFAKKFDIDLNKAFYLVHKSNMSKVCETEEVADKTVEFYKNDKRYDSPAYKKSGDKYVVYNANTGKTLKSIYYEPVSFPS